MAYLGQYPVSNKAVGKGLFAFVLIVIVIIIGGVYYFQQTQPVARLQITSGEKAKFDSTLIFTIQIKNVGEHSVSGAELIIRLYYDHTEIIPFGSNIRKLTPLTPNQEIIEEIPITILKPVNNAEILISFRNRILDRQVIVFEPSKPTNGSVISYERLEITSAYATKDSGSEEFVLHMELRNSGSAPATIDEIFFNGIPSLDVTGCNVTALKGLVIDPGTATATLEITYLGTSGMNLQIIIRTIAGIEYPKLVNLP